MKVNNKINHELRQIFNRITKIRSVSKNVISLVKYIVLFS